MDKYRIDSHKLLFHPGRVSRWLAGENIYPIYLEISPSGACNHRCVFCAFDYIGYKKRFLDTFRLKATLTELRNLGIKSVMYGGEGEPLLHPDITALIKHTADAGIDAAVTTNGVLFGPDMAAATLPCMKWIKVSLNAGSAEVYAAIHRAPPADFERVFANLKAAVSLNDAAGRPCTIGVQTLLLPENRGTIPALAERTRDIGVDYLVVKPYSHHLSSNKQRYRNIDYSGDLALAETLKTFNTDDFRVIFRSRTMEKWNRAERTYDRCLAHPFWAYLDSAGNIWGCSAHMGSDLFNYGNILVQSFDSIWTGSKRREAIDALSTRLDARDCRVNCRMDEINRYLWELKHPGEHVNFI